MSFSHQNRPSKTAMGTALCRAISSLDKNFRGVVTDEIAKYFLNPMTAWLIKVDFFRRRIKKRSITPGVYEYVVARTLHMDSLFIEALEKNLPQIVIFGAGYDSRPYRFKQKIKTTRIFEVDAIDCQQYKLLCMQKARLAWPSQATFVSADLERQDVAPLLADAGYDPGLKTLFILEGLLMYLAETRVLYLLSFIRQNWMADSAIAFDYVYKSVTEGTSNAYGAREQYEAVQRNGEPFKFGLAYDQMNTMLTDKGFRIRVHFRPEDFEKKYLIENKKTKIGKMYRYRGNVVANNSPLRKAFSKVEDREDYSLETVIL